MLFVVGPEGQPQDIISYQLGVLPMNIHRNAEGIIWPFQSGMQVPSLQIMPLQNGNPLTVQQLKKMQCPTATPQVRILSEVGIHLLSVPLLTMQQLQQQPTQSQMLYASTFQQH